MISYPLGEPDFMGCYTATCANTNDSTTAECTLENLSKVVHWMETLGPTLSHFRVNVRGYYILLNKLQPFPHVPQNVFLGVPIWQDLDEDDPTAPPRIVVVVKDFKTGKEIEKDCCLGDTVA